VPEYSGGLHLLSRKSIKNEHYGTRSKQLRGHLHLQQVWDDDREGRNLAELAPLLQRAGRIFAEHACIQRLRH